MYLPRQLLPTLLSLCCFSAAHAAQAIDVVNPNVTGIPGEEVRLARWAPDGRLWVAARWPFWGQGGIGVYDRHSRTWEVWSSATTPLPSQFVNDVEFEADGTAWIATDGGLVRKEGDVWTVWNGPNSPLAFDKVGDLSLAPNGHVWVNNSSFSAAGDAIYDFDGVSTWVKYSVPTQIPFAAPWTDLSEVFVDSQGIVWVANDTLGGVARFNGSTWTLLGAGVDRFDDMAEDGFGNLWLMGHPVGGAYAFYRYNGSAFKAYPISAPQVLLSDPTDGSIYVGSWNGIVVRTADGGQSVQTFAQGLNKVIGLAPDPENDELWIATLGALGHFSAAGDLVADYNTWNTGFPDYFVDSFWSDDEDHFWVATGEAGLSRFDGLRWRNWGNHNVGSEPYPFAGNEPMGAVFQDSTGTHWFGGNGIARWHSDTGQFDGFWNWQNNPGMGVTLFTSFAEDAGRPHVRGGQVRGGVPLRRRAAAVDQRSQRVCPFDLPGMVSDSEGDVWVGAWFDIHHWNGTAWSQVTLPDPQYFFDLGGINVMAIGPDDVLWLGTVEGLVRWDGTTFTRYTPGSTPLPGPIVTGIDVRADGLIGIASRGESAAQPSGVALLDGDPAVPRAGRPSSMERPPSRTGSSPAPPSTRAGDFWVSALSEGAAVVRSGAWHETGGALAGTFREPQLVGKGLPLGGETFGLLLTAPRRTRSACTSSASRSSTCRSSAACWSRRRTSSSRSRPTPPATRTSRPSGPSACPPATQLVFQSWFLDPGAPQGFSATNAALLGSL
jgi:hypothetical protein